MPWGERIAGTDESDREIIIREGTGSKEGEALVSDAETVREIAYENDISEARAFNAYHDHVGEATEGGRIEDKGGDRGAYSG